MSRVDGAWEHPAGKFLSNDMHGIYPDYAYTVRVVAALCWMGLELPSHPPSPPTTRAPLYYIKRNTFTAVDTCSRHPLLQVTA